MKISVITVCRNSVLTIRDTFDSVLAQTYPDIEYIVIDGASDDGTVDIIKEYESRFNVMMRWISERDSGIYDAMNKGVRMAGGDIVGILNSDDRYASNSVLSLVHSAITENNADSCYGDLLYVKNGKPHRYWRAGERKTFVSGWMPPHPAFFVKKAVYDHYGLFRLDCGTAADYEIMLRFLEKHKISTAYIPEIVVLMTAGGVSNMGVKSKIRASIFDDYAWEINNMCPAFYTLPSKKLRKVFQFIKKPIKEQQIK
jgi:glycosyltransferase involved in cell wall biosynthesis